MPKQSIQRMVTLEPFDFWIVQEAARKKGLGSRGFSAALRIILREWQANQEKMEQEREADE